ncbi:MAG TPA: hypothetical protein PK991_08500 [Candidatus Sabulitectum sp.]|nr:hypothetical protein [Candidatus Sabulitectum sp.]
MTGRFQGWLLVSLGVVVQFMLEATLGRAAAAPAVLVPLLVYLSVSRGDYWSIEGALWSGFALDLLTHQTPGTSSLSMILGIWLSGWLLKVTTGAARMTFVATAFAASLFSDLLFVLLASPSPGSDFGPDTLLIVPRIAIPLALYLLVPLLVTGRLAEIGRE